MKKKKLKKLLKKTLNDFSIDKKVDRQFDVKESETATGMNIEFTETDDDTKNKMRSLIIRLLKIRDKVNFHSTDNNIHLNREINNKGSNIRRLFFYDPKQILDVIIEGLPLDEIREVKLKKLLYGK